MDVALLVAYVGLIALAYWRSRSLAWLAIAVVASVSVFGVLVNLGDDLGVPWSRVPLQLMLLASLGVVALAAFLRPAPPLATWRRQAVAIGVPVVVLLVFFTVVTWVLTEEPAFLRPVSYLIGHGTAEDNAKWLDFTAQLATGSEIVQAVPMGGPLQLTLTFVATLMGVLSLVMLGGYNEVAVAANTVVLGSYLLVALTPLALAPLAEMRVRPAGPGSARVRMPWPYLWMAAAVLVSASLVVTGFGHLSFQYTLIVMALWSAAFLAAPPFRRSRLLMSLAAAATMTVWLPLNAMAAVILLAWLVILVARVARRGRSGFDPVAAGLWLVVAVGLWEPIRSSLAYVASGVVGAAGALSDVLPIGGAVRGMVAAIAVPANDGSLFSSPGGTEVTGPILALLAVVAVIGAVLLLSRLGGRARATAAIRFVPVALLVGFALLVTLADFWVTGGGPNYGSLKFTFLATVVALGTCLPLALMVIDPEATGMTLARWAAVGLVGYLLIVDTIVPRALAAARPDQWSPPIPFENTSGSYWWPADVNGEAVQPIVENPVACVYLPAGAVVPSALLASQLSDAQRVYNCSRIISGLAGADTTAQPIVDWLRREWLTNTPAWSNEYPNLAGMPDAVLDKPVILLDDGSNVIGLETMRSLLERFPVTAGQ